MAGISNDYLIYPILQLIREEIKKNNTTNLSSATTGDPFDGEPSVALYRRHPLDDQRVTGAVMMYDSGYRVEIIMNLGSDDPSTFPVDVLPDSPDWEYYSIWRLNGVNMSTFTPDDDPLVTYLISLNYDDRGLLIGTTVDRI
jgi:hypothetical protein